MPETCWQGTGQCKKMPSTEQSKEYLLTTLCCQGIFHLCLLYVLCCDDLLVSLDWRTKLLILNNELYEINQIAGGFHC